MKHLATTALLVGLASISLNLGPRGANLLAATAGENSYFDSLVARSDVWKAYSLRDSAQLASMKNGGYVRTSDVPEFSTYSPATDTDRHKQDATKVVIPAFMENSALTRAVGSSDTVLTLESALKTQYPIGRVIKVDREVMTVSRWLSDTTIEVERGAYSTAPAAHGSGATLWHATNSNRNQIRVPLGTEDGHSYFFTWDSYWTDSFVGAGKYNHKAFQFSSGSQDGDAIFFEVDAGYADRRPACYDPAVHIAAFHARSYNKIGGVLNWLLTDGNSLGPAVTDQSPLPQVADFCMEPNGWVRYFIQLRQRANDYDYLDMWLADETHDPVQVLSNVAISVRPTGPTPNSIQKFWVEFDSSADDHFRIDSRDLVVYVRNFVALRDTDPRPHLIRPVPGAKAAPGPAAPRNVRIISGS